MSGATSTIARHTLAYATGSIVGGVTRAVLLPGVARRLSPEEYGVYSLGLATTNLLHLLFELGLVTALIKFHAEDASPESRRRLRSLVFLGMPLLDLVVAAPVLLARDLVSRVLFGTPEHGAYVAIAVAIAFFAAQFQLYLGHLRADDRSKDFAVLMAVRGALSLTCTFVLVIALDLGLPGFLLGNLAGPALVSLGMIPRLLAGQGVDLTGWRGRLRELLHFGAPLVPSALGMWVLSYLDAYLLRVFAGLDAVGTFNFAAELCLPIALLMTSISLAWPSFAFGRAREADGPAQIARVFRHLFVALVGGALAIALLRREILDVVGSATFRASAPLVPVLALSTCLYGAAQAFMTGVQISGATRRLPVLVLAAIVVNALLNVVLIPRYREMGAAAATVATNVFLGAIVLRASARDFPIPFEIRRIAAVLAAAGLVLAAGEAPGERGTLVGMLLRLPMLALYPLALVATGAVSLPELRALPRVFGEIARGARGAGAARA